MEKSEINLNHFQFKVTKNSHAFFSTIIFVKSLPEYIHLYQGIVLDYSFNSECEINKVDCNSNAIIGNLSIVQKRSLMTTVHKRLNRAIRLKFQKDKLLSSDKDYTSLSNDGIIDDDLDWMKDVVVKSGRAKHTESFEFDFSEIDLVDDFNFDDLPNTIFEGDVPQQNHQTENEYKNANKLIPYPDSFNFDRHYEMVIGGVLETQKELLDTFIESRKLLQQKNELQSKIDQLDKHRERLSKNLENMHVDFKHAVTSQFKTK